MQEPFVVSVGATMFFWRASVVEASSGLWYRCRIQSVTAAPLEYGWEVRAVIRYEDGICQDVRFSIENGNQIATCPHSGRKLLWTLASGEFQQLSSGRKVSSRVLPIAPRLERNACFISQNVPVPWSELPIPRQHGVIEQQNLKSLEKRIRLLETRFDEMSREETNREGAVGSSSHIAMNLERVLQQLRGKMEMILERPLQNVFDSTERHLCIRNEVLRCSVDCSLGEYRELCLAMKKDKFVSSTFEPDNIGEQSTVLLFSTTRIYFLSFGDVCAALGECDCDKLVSCIMKSRRTKTRSSPAMIRIIGRALIPASGNTDPLYITVGSFLSGRTDHLCKRDVPVIRRENMLQDDIDMSFVHELETVVINKPRIQLLCNQAVIEQGLDELDRKRRGRMKTAKRELKGFEMRWVTQRAPLCTNLFEDRTRALQRAGYLELFLPTVLCYNTSQCEEIIAVCTKEFLSASTQRFSSSY